MLLCLWFTWTLFVDFWSDLIFGCKDFDSPEDNKIKKKVAAPKLNVIFISGLANQYREKDDFLQTLHTFLDRINSFNQELSIKGVH